MYKSILVSGLSLVRHPEDIQEFQNRQVFLGFLYFITFFQSNAIRIGPSGSGIEPRQLDSARIQSRSLLISGIEL